MLRHFAYAIEDAMVRKCSEEKFTKGSLKSQYIARSGLMSETVRMILRK
jgi:hypothetical protein